MPTINYSAVPAQLQQHLTRNPGFLQKTMIDGFSAIAKDFTVRKYRDKMVYPTLAFTDAFQSAKPLFSPVNNTVALGARIVQIQRADLDLPYSLDEVEQMAIQFEAMSDQYTGMDDLYRNPFPAMLINEIVTSQMAFLARNASWKGLSNPLVGSINAADGLIRKIIVGSSAGGDIPASNVTAAPAIINETNIYAHIRAMMLNIETTYPDLLGTELQVYLSPTLKRFYDENARTLFPQSFGYGDSAKTVHYFDSAVFHPTLGLSGKETIVITPKANLQAGFDHDADNYRFSIEEHVKSWDISLRLGVSFDYAYGLNLFRNNKV